MLIRSLNVEKYGVCRNTNISDINGDLVVVYGPNEAGKTTCMEFIRGVFFGLAKDGREKYVRGNTEEVFGGSISIESGDGQTWVVSRELATVDGTSKEKLDVLLAGQLHSAATMNREMLKGVDHDIFRNVFTVGLDELQHLNTLNATEAAEFLYEMTTGMDRVSLGEVLRGVTQTRRSIFDRQHEESEIKKLESRVEQLEQLIQHDYRQLEAWSQLRNELRAGKQDIQRVVGKSDELQRSVKLFQIATATRDVWIQRREALKQLKELPDLSENLAEIATVDSVARLRDWEVDRISLNKGIVELEEKLVTIKAQIDSVPINADVAANAARIHAICEHASWLVSLQDQVASLMKDVAELGQQSDSELSTGFLDRLTGPMPEVDHHVLRSVKQAETELTFADERRAEQALLVEQSQMELGEVEQSWMDLVVANAPQLICDAGHEGDATNAGFDDIGFESLLARVGADIGVLRTRLVLDDQQTRLQREIAVTEGRIASPNSGLPTGKVLVASAGLAVAGFVAVAVGFVFPGVFSLAPAAATLIGILGVVCSASGIAYRVLDSRRGKQETAVVMSRQTLLSRQTVKCLADIAVIESSNDLGGASWDIQLRDLQEQHSILESMVPVLAKLKTAKARLQLTRTRLIDCQCNADEAQESWASVLVEQGLPTRLRPSDVHAIVDNTDVIAHRKRRLDDRKAELARREADLADLVNRIEQLLIDLDMQPESAEAAVQIRQLNRLLNKQREAKQQRKILKKSVRKLKTQRNKIIAKRQDLETSLNRVFVRAGVSDLAELEQLSQSHCGALELRRLCDDASDIILQQLKGKEFSENELYAILDKYDGSELLGEIKQLDVQIYESTETLAKLHEEQGQKKQKLQQLLDDTSLDSAKLALTAVVQRLADAQRQWRVWAVTEFVLQQVRDIYELKRQPETLVDAGQWIAKISNGKYTRIWTPLDEDALYVDDAIGQTWGLDMLSRGTRESVFICLRLALVNSYTKRGVRLPLILDDVLVNCDAERAKHGVSMLRDFAKQGTQVFFFTCHSHLAERFEAVNADVRVLTLRDDVVAPDLQRFSNVSVDEMSQRNGVEKTPQRTVVAEFDAFTDAEKNMAEEELAEEELAEEELAEEELAEEELAEEEDIGIMSTQHEIEVVERLVETVAAEMEQIDSNFVQRTVIDGQGLTNMDIGELVERAMDESDRQEDAEEYDEIEIIDEDTDEVEIVSRGAHEDEGDDWDDQDTDENLGDFEDELAA